MVDALRRAHRIAAPDGIVVDLHPSASAAVVEVGDRLTGYVNAADGRRRHAAADAAIAAVVNEGLFAIERTLEFPFHTHADTVEELRDYINEHWRDARLDDATVRRTRAWAQEMAGARPRSRERVILTVMRPLRSPGERVPDPVKDVVRAFAKAAARPPQCASRVCKVDGGPPFQGGQCRL